MANHKTAFEAIIQVFLLFIKQSDVCIFDVNTQVWHRDCLLFYMMHTSDQAYMLIEADGGENDKVGI